MLSPYQLENLTSLVIGELVLLEWIYRARSHLELLKRFLFDMCFVDCYDDMKRDLCGISNEDWFTPNDSSPSRSVSKEISNFGLPLARMRRHVTFAPDTVFENQRTSKNKTFLPSSSDGC